MVRRVHAATVIAVTVVIAATTGGAQADELDRAKQLEAALEYEQALAVVDGLLAGGGADPARFVELELFAGRLAGGLDRAAVAEAHFARALAVRPDAALPAGSSPKITGPFAAARSRVRPLRVELRTSASDVTVEVPEAAGLIRTVEVVVVDAARAKRTVRGAPPLRVELRTGETPAGVVALDERGNRVWTGTARARPATASAIRTRPVVARPSTWLAVATVGLAAGGLSAWRFSVAQSDFDRLRDEGGHDFTELEAVERRGRRWAIAADVGFGVAIAGGIASGILYLRRSPARRDAAVTWLFTGTGLAAHGRF